MRTPGPSETLTFDGWPHGVNNRLRETEGVFGGDRDPRSIPANQALREAINVDLTRMGRPLRRDGYDLVEPGFTHSLWSDPQLDWGLVVREGWLARVRPRGELEPLEEVHPYAPMSYAVANGVAYYSNGIDRGRVDAMGPLHWGLDRPAKPELTVTQSGALDPGTYRVALTYEDSTGEEHGASQEATTHVAKGEGLRVTAFGPWPPEALWARVYVSRPEGEVLYHAVSLAAPGSAVIDPSMLERGMELETAEMRAPSPGHIVRYFSGRMYIARRDTIIFTEPLRYSLTRPSQGVYMFPSDVTLMEPVLDGIYVGFEGGVVFIAGTDPYQVEQVNVLQHSPVPRASTMIPGESVGANSAHVPVWWGKDGAMVAGLPGGQVEQLTKDRLATPRFASGAVMYREREGMAQVVSSLHRGGEPSMAGASDSAVAEVRRATRKLNCTR